ncbi:Uncharacterized protein HZ326_24377 [Fusarium oxysporum f. sp. albedinis]|nr:Uncharacterized protein HZ326_24377 [Fusarium oxysporum f. sp. albedinis]
MGQGSVRYAIPRELLSLFCPFKCFPRYPVLIYPGTHKMHVSFIEALSLIQQDLALRPGQSEPSYKLTYECVNPL